MTNHGCRTRNRTHHFSTLLSHKRVSLDTTNKSPPVSSKSWVLHARWPLGLCKLFGVRSNNYGTCSSSSVSFSVHPPFSFAALNSISQTFKVFHSSLATLTQTRARFTLSDILAGKTLGGNYRRVLWTSTIACIGCILSVVQAPCSRIRRTFNPSRSSL